MKPNFDKIENNILWLRDYGLRMEQENRNLKKLLGSILSVPGDTTIAEVRETMKEALGKI